MNNGIANFKLVSKIELGQFNELNRIVTYHFKHLTFLSLIAQQTNFSSCFKCPKTRPVDVCLLKFDSNYYTYGERLASITDVS